ncbi:hypothetical protein DV702_08105 [Sporosarcina sp. PTS2304]|uniref:hypothetical protein n=1 Tax=Sporosarcina sp. PTS2304 TaxID=2283194 RepID=UPI000E0CE932|nr:hypothetical protein [Sporosarcina sp. PTS2304]AXH99697.1 hypothetical protein DV702_08105 [Sporosarcina sp. PTS2304]
MNETKKPLMKRWWFIMLIVISAFSFTLGVWDSKNKRASEEELPIEEQIMKKVKFIDEASMTDDGLLTIISIINSNTEDVSIAPTSINWAFKTMQAAFEFPDVSEVNIVIQVMIIKDGKESKMKELPSIRYTREEFENTSFEKFSKKASE